MNSDYLWYVSYGSNMLEERFRAYIEGGYCRFNGNSYDGCEDKIFPQKSKSIELPYDMYYGNYSPSWCGAVSFLDVSNKNGHSYCRAWLIKKSQLKKIHEQECDKLNWYPTVFKLDDIDGIKAVTLTNETNRTRLGYNDVPDLYKIVLTLGLKETFPNLSDAEIKEYLESR